MKVNDYVRTKDGVIAKVIDVRENPYGEKTIFKLDKEISIYDLEYSDIYSTINPLANDTTNETDTHFGDEKIIVKSSSNIIDLIEVGDYVNGTEVYYKTDKLIAFDLGQEGEYYIENNEIETIVTKEQFESMEYKIGSDK